MRLPSVDMYQHYKNGMNDGSLAYAWPLASISSCAWSSASCWLMIEEYLPAGTEYVTVPPAYPVRAALSVVKAWYRYVL